MLGLGDRAGGGEEGGVGGGNEIRSYRHSMRATMEITVFD